MSGAHKRGAEWRAGGTDLSERLRSGVSDTFAGELTPAPGMLDIVPWGDGLRVGAMVPIQQLADDPRVKAGYAALAGAAGGLATPQVRAMATVAGNLTQRTRCWYYRHPHTSCLKKGGEVCPARDGNHLLGVLFDQGPCVAPHPSTLGAALLAYEATIETTLGRTLTVEEVFGDGRDGSRDHQLAEGELISALLLAPPGASERATYRRATGRHFAEWPLVELVVRLGVSEGRVTLARVVAGGVANTPLRLRAAEDALQGHSLNAATIARAAQAALESARPLPMTAYKGPLLQGLLRDQLDRLASG